ncbi:SwmB domain-containing protein [Reichenbachiella carrageenanivorans]|uniref:SwmB domain-containing protein n=1 Tax=Reichenbachiella carrageenanivorans TaxID=2979869 RepID=A0ABY6D5C9_9BACT|nr:SwmB domain-containing protein [Reichenbachiella carrageenanivorans]UXX81099.1 SwmB domain-containing protein [Reichenbachiella carrageenanivorans]
MKNRGIILALFALTFILGCAEDEYVAPTKVVDVSWYTSIHPGTPYSIDVDTYIAFMDLSQNELSHKWVIEEGNHFLKNGFSNNDTLAHFIDETAGLETDEKTINVLFAKTGLNTVRLYNTFSEPVTYPGTVPLEAYQETDVWVIDTTMVVDVYGDLEPAFKVFQNGTEILNIPSDSITSTENIADWPVIDVEVNTTLTFVDMTTQDRPNGRSWEIAGTPATSGDSVAVISFLQYGTTANLGRFTSTRGGDRPTKSRSKIIPLKVRVVSSAAPFELIGEASELEDEVITFQVAGVIDDNTLAGQTANFTVHVTNADAAFDADIPVQSLAVNSEDGSMLELTLSQPIYNSDVITVSYAGGSIKSTDARDLQDFSTAAVETYKAPNVLTDSDRYGFETYVDTNGNAKGWWSQHPQWQRSGDQAATGDFSMSWSTDDYAAVPNATTTHGDGDMTLPADVYTMSIKVWIDPASGIEGVRTNLTPWQLIEWDFTGIAKGSWVTLSQTITTAAVTTKMVLQYNKADSPALTGAQKFYVDDISFVPLELRP